MNRKRIFTLIVALTVFFASTLSYSSFALDVEIMDMYGQNSILFYDPNGGCNGGGVSVCGTNLPEETIKRLESDEVKEKAEANMERYKYAEEKTGIPWQAVAALHYRENTSMSNTSSISNGGPLASAGSCYTNVDGIRVCSDAKEDAAQAAGHLISMAKMVYDVELSKSSNVEEWGKAFLAYNRGFIYVWANTDWKLSPYPMNGFDEEHALYMTRPPVEARYTSLGKDGNVGALAVFAYLCGSEGGSASSGSSSGSSDGSDVTIIGDSITVASEAKIKELLPQADIYAQDCKTVGYDFSGNCGSSTGENKSGLTIVKELKENKLLRDKVVILLGTNMSGFDKLQNVVDEIGSNKKIYLMSLYEKEVDHSSQNRIIEEIVKDNSNVKLIDWATKVSSNSDAYIADGVHPNDEGKGVFAELIYDAVLASGGTCNTGTNGFSSVEEAQIIIENYNKSNLDAYGLIMPATGDRHHNCVAFTTWFINNYTEISYTNPPNGRDLVNDFYNRNKGQYPDLEISNEPSVYSIASWSVPGQFTASGNHTGVVVGIDQSKDLLLIAEAGWNSPGFTGVHERSLSGAVANGYQYININSYLKSNTELK